MKKCNFCGLNKENVSKLDNMLICDECKEIVNSECQITVNKVSNSSNKILKPQQLKKELDKYVVRQDDAKIALATEIYNHLRRTHLKELSGIEKNNILLMGPSGCGKTYLVQTIAKLLDIPIITVNATEFTASGYVGKSVDSIGKWILKAAGGDYEKAERGIVYIDEIDKIACRNANRSIVEGSKDVGGLEVQKELLKIIEGTTLRLNEEFDAFYDEEDDTLDTKNILFIFSGAFEDMDIINSLGKEKKISFDLNNNEDDLTDELMLSDKLIKFGFLKEFIGRIPIITKIEKLEEKDIIEIMTKKENNICSQYKKLFASEGIDLEFTPSAIKYLAKIAIKSNLGARGLKSIIGNLMNKLIYITSSTNKSSIKIDVDLINELLNLKKKQISKN